MLPVSHFFYKFEMSFNQCIEMVISCENNYHKTRLQKCFYKKQHNTRTIIYTLACIYMHIHVPYLSEKYSVNQTSLCKDIQIWKGDAFLNSFGIFITLKVIIILKLTVEAFEKTAVRYNSINFPWKGSKWNPQVDCLTCVGTR